MKLKAENFIKDLQKFANKSDAKFLQRYFKTGKGEYGEGDVFLGVRMPALRRVCQVYKNLPLLEIEKLLKSPLHEHRLGAVILLRAQYEKADKNQQKNIYNLYIKQLKKNRINNWDIVDVSCHKIVGQYNLNNFGALLKLSKGNLWERRVSVISTFANIAVGDVKPTFRIAKVLLRDKHDLIHKAVGWALREAGKKDLKRLLSFLEKHASLMPRVMLRYACEKLTKTQRQHFYSLK